MTQPAKPASGAQSEPASELPVEWVALSDLKPHPKNYQEHPEDQIEHLMESLREHGFYKNVVAAQDLTVLGGHGVLKAAKKLGLKEAPVIRLPLDPMEPRALKVLAADNEISHLSERDDRALTELLREIREHDPIGLLGTGYDEMMLANLLMVTRSAGEIKDFDAAAHWVGMPGYEAPTEITCELVIRFDDDETRQQFIKEHGIVAKQVKDGVSAWWPAREVSDVQSLEWSNA